MSEKKYKITILGCGGSIGVPSIERGWELCDSSNPKNYRKRTSALVEIIEEGKEIFNLLFDAGPDFREQALNNNLQKIDTLLFTHAHADHIFGIDELRSINRLMQEPITSYAEKITLDQIKAMFSYIFKPHPKGVPDRFYRPQLDLEELFYNKKIELKNNSIILPTKQIHGRIETTGFVLDNKIGYATDFVSLPEETIESYKNLEVLVISAFTRKIHDAHMCLENVLKVIEDTKPKKAILTHMGATMDYSTLVDELPSNVIPAYDGLIIETE